MFHKFGYRILNNGNEKNTSSGVRFLLSYISEYSDLLVSTITQRSSIHYTGSWQLLHYLLASMYGSVEVILSETAENNSLRVFDAITIVQEPPVVVLEVMFLHRILTHSCWLMSYHMVGKCHFLTEFQAGQL